MGFHSINLSFCFAIASHFVLPLLDEGTESPLNPSLSPLFSPSPVFIDKVLFLTGVGQGDF